jgi:hypothetical protein
MNQMQSLRSKIEASLEKGYSEVNQKKWAMYIVKNKIPLRTLADILLTEGKAATRFSWLIGGVCQIDPQVVFPEIEFLFHLRSKVKVPGFSRSLARMMWLCGIPESIEGEATECLFQWLMDANESISAKVYSIHALEALVIKYPELKGELIAAIESQMNHYTPAFKRCGMKAIGKLLEKKENRSK